MAALGCPRHNVVVLQALSSFLLDCPGLSVATQRCSEQQVPS